MKSKLKPRKIQLIGAMLVFGILLQSTPSYALSLNISDFFNDILDEFKGYFDELKNELIEQIEADWGGLKQDAKEAINESIGEMDVPDPVSGAEKLRQKLKTKGTPMESNTVVGAIEAGRQLERQTVRASVASILGEEGQARTNKEIESTQKTVDEAKNLGDRAQEMDASQNILKAIAAQNAQVVSMLGQSRTDELQARQDAANTNLMLEQIAENGASDRRRQSLAMDGELATQISIGAWTRLRATTPDSASQSN